MIPFLDLRKINHPYQEKFKTLFAEILECGVYIKSNYVQHFENEFARYCGVPNCITVGNGHDALFLILKGYIELGILKNGDEILVAANTFIATVLSIKNAGLQPVMVEPNEENFTIDPTAIKKIITKDTKAIVVTHLYGQLADMVEINKTAKENNLLVIADAAQAHGARTKENKVAGSLCNATAFSFYPTKNLGALGDAGAITTSDDDLAEVIRCIANYGSEKKYVNKYAGVNSRMDEFQAAFLIEKLKNLEKDNEKRQRVAKQYLDEIKNKKIKLPFWGGEKDHVFHLFVIRVSDRKAFCEYLDKSGIGYLIHYPIPPHHQEAFKELSTYSFPITERIHKEVVSIPLNVGLNNDEIKRIIAVINQF